MLSNQIINNSDLNSTKKTEKNHFFYKNSQNKKKETTVSLDLFNKKCLTSQNNQKNEATSYKTWQKQQTKKYINYSEISEQKIKDYKSRHYLLKDNKKIEMKHDALALQKDNYLWFIYNSIKMQELLSDKTAIFTTSTVPGQLHKYGKKSEKMISKRSEKELIEESYELLKQFHRAIYKNFRVNRKPIKVHFTRVIEPHHDYTPHAHAIYYVDKEYVEDFKRHFENCMKTYKLGKQYDLEVLLDVKKATAYISKYIQKTQKPDNMEDFHIYNGWKKINKIRVFTMSINKLPRYIYRRINTALNLTKNTRDKNPIDLVLNKCEINIETFDEMGALLSTKKLGTGNKYNVYVQKIKKIKELTEDDKIKIRLENELDDDELIEDKIYYQLKEFTIHENDIEIYNKNDFKLLTKTEEEIFNYKLKIFTENEI